MCEVPLLDLCVCMCVCVFARARVCNTHTHTHTQYIDTLCERFGSSDEQSVFFFLLHNHIINIKKKYFSGEVKDSVIFPFFFVLHK